MPMSCRGKNSTRMSAAKPTSASQMRSFVKSAFTRGFNPAPMLKPTIGIQPAAMPTTMEMTIWKNFITIPTTAIGICAYCACEKISSSAPYLRSMLLIAAIAATREICERKLVMPSPSVRPQTAPSSRKSCFESFTIFM